MGTISPAFRYCGPPGEERAHRDVVRFLCGHFWCEGWWARKWEQIWPWYEHYYGLVKDTPYRELAKCTERVADWNRQVGGTESTAGPSSDTALQRAIDLSGYRRLRLVVNRATGIGEIGLHCTPEAAKELGEFFQPVPCWDDEDEISQFIVKEQGQCTYVST